MPSPAPIKIKKLGMVTAESVFKCTGKNWDQWIKILDTAGAGYWDHKEIVAHLKKKHKLTPWWQQGVTLGYEYHKGRRIEGMSQKGTFTTTSTKSLSVDAAQAWKLLVSPRGQRAWLRPLSPLKIQAKSTYESEGGIFGMLRTFKAPRRLRLSWQETEWAKPTVLQVHVVPRPNRKCILVFSHEGLKDGRLRLQMRTHWKNALADFAKLVDGRPG